MIVPRPLVTLADAKAHLYITDPARDAEVTAKLGQASATILAKCDTLAQDSWTETTAPPEVQAATLLVLGLLFEHRGDDLAPDDHGPAVWTTIELLLKRWWKPAIA
jgi:hypothetical protein